MRANGGGAAACCCACGRARLRARADGRRGCGRRRRERRHGQVRGRRRRGVLRGDGGARPASGRSSPFAGCPSDPLALQERPLLDLTVAAARAAGLDVVFATYPYPPREMQARAGAARGVRRLARRARARVSGGAAVRRRQRAEPAGVLAAAVREREPALRPGVRPVPRRRLRRARRRSTRRSTWSASASRRAGNDRPHARSNVSTSPVRFLAALGAWYRASGRELPLMDGLSFHPYPNRATDPLERGYAWPNAGFVNLDRIKQAVWDAFAGTRAADDARRAAPVPRRGGLAGRHDRPRGLLGRRERRRHRRGDAGRGLRRARAASGVRPGHRPGQRLRLPGRRARERASRRRSTASTARRGPRRSPCGRRIEERCVRDRHRAELDARHGPCSARRGPAPGRRRSGRGRARRRRRARAARVCLLPGTHTLSSARRRARGARRRQASVPPAPCSRTARRRSVVARAAGPQTLAVQARGRGERGAGRRPWCASFPRTDLTPNMCSVTMRNRCSHRRSSVASCSSRSASCCSGRSSRARRAHRGPSGSTG